MIFIVTYGGGRGDKTWDAEMEIDAPGLREALEIAEPKVKEARGTIFSIAPKD